MTSEGCCETDEHCKDMEDRQPDVNQNGVHRINSLKSDTVGPGAFTSLHGLNILSEQTSQDGEGNTIHFKLFKLYIRERYVTYVYEPRGPSVVCFSPVSVA